MSEVIEGKRILITGGGGFIGSHLVADLIDKNLITILDLKVSNKSYLNKFNNHKNLNIIRGDLLNINNLENLKNVSFDYIIHAAGILGVQNVIDNPIESILGNFISTKNILEFSSTQKNLKKFLFLSTSEVYGDNCLNATEDDKHIIDAKGIRGNYACSKSLSEFLVKAYQKSYGLKWICIRPFNVYGPYRYNSYAVLNFIKLSILNKDIIINNKGDQVRTWCYISDFCQGILNALRDEEVVDEVFNLGDDLTQITITNLVKKIIFLTGSNSKIIYGENNLSEEIMFRSPNIDKAKRILKYRSNVSLEQGLQNTINWVNEEII